MRKQPKILFEKSIESLLLSIDHFNRISELGRHEAVLILLDRAFELLLKSVILHKGGKIREKREKFNIGFDKCIKKCLSDEKVKCLNEDQSMTIQILNGFRDAAQHDVLDMSEQDLCTYSMAAITVYGEILRDTLGKKLTEYLPERILLISTQPIQDFQTMIEADFKTIKKLLEPNARKEIQAKSKLKMLAIIEDTLQGDRSQPSESEIKKIVKQVKMGKSWQKIFPSMANLQISTKEGGLNVKLTISKTEGEKISIVPEGEGRRAIAIKRVNELDYYSLGRDKLAEKISLTGPKTSALIEHLKIKDNDDYYKEFKIGSVIHKMYSPKAIEVIRNALQKVDMLSVWEEYRNKTKRKR